MTLLNAALNGPLIVLLVMVLLAVLLRWTFSDHDGPPSQDDGQPDYGLLVPVATVRTSATAAALQTQLAERGVRSTIVSAGPDGGLHLLVFRADAATAERLLSHLN